MPISSPVFYNRGDIWHTVPDPTVGDEIQKSRPCVIINSNAIGKLRIKLVAPITEWQVSFTGNLWHVKIEPNSQNGLTKTSAVDVLQLRGVDMDRFTKRIGKLTPNQMEEIVAAIAAVIEYT